MPHLYFCSYAPLCISSKGRVAIAKHKLAPFIDGSIRREPDFEHKNYPAISCLCRGGQFAPRLHPGDVVVYLTKKHRFGEGEPRRYLTAILKVVKRFESHEEAAEWYRSEGYRLPSNCLVEGNAPQPWKNSHQQVRHSGCAGPKATHRAWDRSYRRRSREHKVMLACNPLHVNVYKATPVSDEQLRDVLGGVPSTQNPGAYPVELLKKLAAKLEIRLSS